MAKYTVIWRPATEFDFRVDWVTTQPGDQHLILAEAAQQYLEETDQAFDVLARPYDLIAIFEGHQTDIRTG